MELTFCDSVAAEHLGYTCCPGLRVGAFSPHSGRRSAVSTEGLSAPNRRGMYVGAL